MVVIANGDVNMVINHSRIGGVKLSVDVRVASSADLSAVSEVLQSTAEEAGVEKPLVGVAAFDAVAVTLRLTGTVPPQERDARELHLKGLLYQRLREMEVPLV